MGNAKREKLDALEDKRTIPVFVKYGLIGVAVIAVLVVGLLIYFSSAESYVATVNGEKIKTGEFKYYLEIQKQTMYYQAYQANQSLTEETFWNTKIGGEDAVEVAKKIAVSNAKDSKVQYLKAKEAKVELTADVIKSIDENIDKNIVDTMGEGNRIRANKAFEKEYGFKIDDLRNVQIENYTAQQYLSEQVSKITDEDANVDTYYAEKPEWYKGEISARSGAEEAVWARHILITVAESATQDDKDAAKKKAEDIIAKIKSGTDFVSLVAENSEDPGSKDVGGEYIFGKGKMDPEFEAAAFALNPGQVTEEPVMSQFGYHIIKLEEKFAKDEPVSLRCAKEFNELGTNFIKNKLIQEKVDEWIESAKYELNSSVYDSIK